MSVSPKRFGAGPVVIIDLQPDHQRADGDAPDRGARRQPARAQAVDDPIEPRGTGTLKVDVREGDYAAARATAASARRRSRSASSASRPRTTCWSHDARRRTHPRRRRCGAALVARRAGRGAEDRDPALLLRAAAQPTSSTSRRSRTSCAAAAASSTAASCSATSRATSAPTPSCACSPAAPPARSRSTSSPPTIEKSGKLPRSFRSQELRRAQTRVREGVLRYRSAAPKPGDELCCPTQLAESRLRWRRRRAPLRASSRARDVRAAARGPGALRRPSGAAPLASARAA